MATACKKGDQMRALLVLAFLILLAGGLALAFGEDTYGIRRMSRKYRVPENIIRSVVRVESDGNILAMGLSGERGLMQIKRDALTDVNAEYDLGFAWDEMFNAGINIETGTAYLALLKAKYPVLRDDWRQVLRAYNAGIGNYINHREPYWSQSSIYADKVLA